MGSPLAHVLDNLFLGHHEKRWLENEEANSVLQYTRDVDDIFCLFKNEEDAENFFDFLNRQHPNIKFTMEKEIMGKLPFLGADHMRRASPVSRASPLQAKSRSYAKFNVCLSLRSHEKRASPLCRDLALSNRDLGKAGWNFLM